MSVSPALNPSSFMFHDGEYFDPATAEEQAVRDTTFYLNDQMTTFKVENRLFNVHRYFFIRESDIFQTMFHLPCDTEGPVDGMSDDKPLVLPDVTIAEFESLLQFFYMSMFDPEKPAQYWINLLSISTRFAFDRVRERAIMKLEGSGLNPIDQIDLAQRYDIPQWLTPAYKLVLQRIKPLDIEEAQKIGLKTTVLLAKAREIAREESRHPRPRSRRPPMSPQPIMTPSTPLPPEYDWMDSEVVAETVTDVFGKA